jgi:carbamate kinase
MGPKVRGLIEFLEVSASPTAFALIGPLDGVTEAVAGRAGTRITRT